MSWTRHLQFPILPSSHSGFNPGLPSYSHSTLHKEEPSVELCWSDQNLIFLQFHKWPLKLWLKSLQETLHQSPLLHSKILGHDYHQSSHGFPLCCTEPNLQQFFTIGLSPHFNAKSMKNPNQITSHLHHMWNPSLVSMFPTHQTSNTVMVLVSPLEIHPREWFLSSPSTCALHVVAWRGLIWLSGCSRS